MQIVRSKERRCELPLSQGDQAVANTARARDSIEKIIQVAIRRHHLRAVMDARLVLLREPRHWQLELVRPATTSCRQREEPTTSACSHAGTPASQRGQNISQVSLTSSCSLVKILVQSTLGKCRFEGQQ